MKIINNQKSKQAVWAEGDYEIINIEPSDKNGTWLVVRNDMILFASSTLADAKRYVETFTFYGKDESLQKPIDSTGSLRQKLDRRLKVLGLEMMSKEDFREFVRKIPRVKLITKKEKK